MRQFKRQPYQIALSGIPIVILFIILPFDPGYELGLVYVPFFYLALGFFLALLYWLLIKIFKQDFKLIYYLFFFGNLLWGLVLTLDMAFGIFGF